MLISPDELTYEVVFDVYRNAYMSPELDREDEQVTLEIDDVRVRASVDRERRLFNLLSVWGVEASASERQILDFCNSVNATLILIRVYYVAEHSAFVADHATVTEGGITGEEIVKATRQFAAVLRGLGQIEGAEVLR